MCDWVGGLGVLVVVFDDQCDGDLWMVDWCICDEQCVVVQVFGEQVVFVV